MILTDDKERNRFLKFAMVGAVGSVIDIGIANMLTHYSNTPLTFAGTISFICAVTSNFIWNRYWTYPESRSRHILHQIGMFFLVNLAGIAIRIPILHYVEPVMMGYFNKIALRWASPEFVARNFTLALAIGVVMLWNFFINRYWTYNDIE